MKLIFIAICIFYVFLELKTSFCQDDDENIPEDALLTIPEYVTKYGYPIEVYHVVTEDGYILEIHRIPHGIAKNAGPKSNKTVVYLQHGLLASSACYIITGPKKALAFILADHGYDVWLGNARGSKYSRNHTTLTPSEPEFWDFSWHEIGIYDLPVMIDYTLKHTGQKNLYYVGHSQGTTSFYVMASELPEINNKIKLMISLAPIAYMKHIRNTYLQALSKLVGTGDLVLKMIGEFEFLPSEKSIAQYGNVACSSGKYTQVVCKNVCYQMFGYNEEQMDADMIPVIAGHLPAGSSTKQLMHYGHLINSGRFEQYDYGPIENMAKYNSLKPPIYNLEKITAPVVLVYSRNDLLSEEIDVLRLYEELGNPVEKYLVSDDLFNHMDYCTGKDANIIVYDYVLKFLQKY